MTSLGSKLIKFDQQRPLISRSFAVFVLSVLVGIFVYPKAISSVIDEVVNRSDSSHGIFVPVLTGYFLWTIKDRIKETDIRYSWIGIPIVFVCLLLPLIGINNFQIQFIAFIGVVCGLVFGLMGNNLFKLAAFPIVFLITMVPLPQNLYDGLANISRTIAFGGSLKIISMLGIPHLRVGWDIELPNAVLRVAISCSGIRYLISYMVFGVAYAYIYKPSATSRILTVLATIPISFFASICRLTIIFIMTYWVSPFWAEHRPHVILSWFVFVIVLLASINLDKRVSRSLGDKNSVDG